MQSYCSYVAVHGHCIACTGHLSAETVDIVFDHVSWIRWSGNAGEEWRKRAESLEAEVATFRQLLSHQLPATAVAASSLLVDQPAGQHTHTSRDVLGK